MNTRDDAQRERLKAGEIPCPNCKKPLKLTALTCPHCGTQFSKRDVDGRLKANLKFQTGCAIVGIPIALLCLWALMPSDAEKAKRADELAVERQEGQHCLDGWDGENRSVVAATKAQLRDPTSFEHIETRISPRADTGTHTLIMRYRARNGFGGMMLGVATVELNNADCSISSLSVE